MVTQQLAYSSVIVVIRRNNTGFGFATHSHVIVTSGINAHAFVFKKINIMLYKVLHIDTELLQYLRSLNKTGDRHESTRNKKQGSESF